MCVGKGYSEEAVESGRGKQTWGPAERELGSK